ncbi:MAG: hypothetical protein E7617_02020 [Ruminococcaceae bacterium]|nr:hypothetical protein [Oscillospiraceae bacterium]
MKKIICLLMVFACMFSMASCNLFNKDNGDGEVKSDVAKISDIIAESQPTRIVSHSDYQITGGKLLKGIYTTQVDRVSGKSQFDFSYVKRADVADMNPAGSYVSVEGTVCYNADGSVSSEIGDAWLSSGTGYLPYSLSIAEVRFESYTVSEDKNTLTAEITSAESRRVFGVQIESEGNITLTIETDGTYLHYVTVSYATENATVTVKTSYDYGLVTLDF